jgi:transmembrane sensor
LEKEKYDFYHWRDLILDDDFRAGVRGNAPEANQFWESWVSEHPSRRADAAKARAIIQTLTFKETQVAKRQVDAEWEKLHAIVTNIDSKYEPEHSATRFWTIWRLISAAVVLLASIFVADHYLFTSPVVPTGLDSVVQKTENGEQQDLTLPDGTQVRLNAGSSISYPEEFLDTLREVTLTGEAYFQVVGNKNAPFVIHTGKVTTQVVGTSFNISAYPDNGQVRIAVVEGKVSVNTKEMTKKSAVCLTKDEMATFEEEVGELVVSNFEKDDLIAWKDGILCFEKADFTHSIKTLERWYGVKVEVSKNRKLDPAWRFSGKFKDKSLDYILNVMSYPNKFSYKINENIVNLY